MKNNEVVFILDKSGSMQHLTSDTIGGFNSVLKEQKDNKEDGEVYVSTILFNESYDIIHDRLSIDEVPDMDNKTYRASGCTALLDAVGESIEHIEKIHKYIRKEDLPEHTLFVIITDGEENSSHKYRKKDIKKMIEEKKNNDNWEFLFIGANMDSISEAGSIGIDRDSAFEYMNDSIGNGMVYSALNCKISGTRKSAAKKKCSNACLKALNIDKAKRSKNK